MKKAVRAEPGRAAGSVLAVPDGLDILTMSREGIETLTSDKINPSDEVDCLII